jgi:hypothetical protein
MKEAEEKISKDGHPRVSDFTVSESKERKKLNQRRRRRNRFKVRTACNPGWWGGTNSKRRKKKTKRSTRKKDMCICIRHEKI